MAKRKTRTSKPRTKIKPWRYYRFDGAKVNGLWYLLLKNARKNGWDGRLNGPRSGARTRIIQAALYALYLAGRGAPAFHPNGPSRHLRKNIGKGKRWRQAVDVSDADGLIAAAAKDGVKLHRPYPHEPWHVEAVEPFHRKDVL